MDNRYGTYIYLCFKRSTCSLRAALHFFINTRSKHIAAHAQGKYVLVIRAEYTKYNTRRGEAPVQSSTMPRRERDRVHACHTRHRVCRVCLVCVDSARVLLECGRVFFLSRKKNVFF